MDISYKTKKSIKMKQIKVEMKRQGLEMEINRQDFAMALKTWRLRQGLSQAQVGERWGCSRYTIMRAEGSREISWEHAYKLFAKLAVELEKEDKG